jgi:hypothetical protein
MLRGPGYRVEIYEPLIRLSGLSSVRPRHGRPCSSRCLSDDIRLNDE